MLGEDLTRFRNASKELYLFLRTFSWNQKAERLGFDEVFLDFTDVIDYNVQLLNYNDLRNSWFHLNKADPTIGFCYNANEICGNALPTFLLQPSSPLPAGSSSLNSEMDDILSLHLRLASHLGNYLRHQLDEHKGYTSAVGISTNKLLSKLVGKVNKPNNQTTLMPPYAPSLEDGDSNVIRFVDNHDIGQIPGIGFKISQKLREFVLQGPAKFELGLIYGGTKENITVQDVRLYSGMSPDLLEEILRGPGSPKGIGSKVWGLIHGVDDSEVSKARSVPQQISIEDSYVRLDTFEEVKKKLRTLAENLIRRMHLDLTSVHDSNDANATFIAEGSNNADDTSGRNVLRRWIAHPTTLRLTTRPRLPRDANGVRTRSFNRISRSGTMPMFVFEWKEAMNALVERFVIEALVPLFKKLHPEKSGWSLSLINIAATNIVMAATDNKDGWGRDIGTMFRTQVDVLKEWKIEDQDDTPSAAGNFKSRSETERCPERKLELSHREDQFNCKRGLEEDISSVQASQEVDDIWESDDNDLDLGVPCIVCGATMPSFAFPAHERFHMNPE